MNAISDAPKIVVYTGDLSYSVRKGIVAIDEAIEAVQWLIVLHRPRRRPARLIRNQWRNLRRNGWRWIPYQIKEFCRWAATPRRNRLASQNPGDKYGIAALESMSNVQVLRTDDIHSNLTIDAVLRFSPHLGLSLAAPILRPPVFTIPQLGTLNLHKGRLPDYRGMPPAFWELWNDEQEIGCTVHRVAEGLDTGEIVMEETVARERHATVRGLQLQLDEVGVDLMRMATTRVLSGDYSATPQATGGHTYRKPTLTREAELRRRLSRMSPSYSTGIKTLLKGMIARAATPILSGAMRRLVSPRITVLLYHRVSDDARDNLTVGVEQFERQMALLRRHCRVLSLAEVLASDPISRADEPLVCVTFDDGYLDNYTRAVPILLRHGIPAAFFVSTGIVNSERCFPHDRRRGNGFIPLMTWDHLRAMQHEGFTIGSHTVSHIDCAAEAEDLVWRELVQSRDDLRRELGIDDVVLAYPYGGRANMTSKRLELVKHAGYRACLSAYGGVNLGCVDPFNVLRRGVHWEYPDSVFLYRCLGF